MSPPSGFNAGSSPAGDLFEMPWGIIPTAPHPGPAGTTEDGGWNNVDTWILMEKIERLEHENAKLSTELKDALYKAYALATKLERSDTNLEKSNLRVKELEQNLASTMQLAGSFKKERDENINEGDPIPTIKFLMFCSEFSSAEIRGATGSFDPSLKIGEDAYGDIYKGFLRFTQVSVKIPHPDNPSIPQEFQQEVEILCMLRHHNIVNLIGICPESHALIYEHCANGTLEDRLANKDQGSPFPWQTRVKIATELSTVLAFLHSHKPNPVLHGDLRPDNIHLDSNDTCRIIGFRMISSTTSKGEPSLEKKASFYKKSYSEVRSYPYTDPEFFAGGDLTTGSDVYALGIILMQLLTGTSAAKLLNRVRSAMGKDELDKELDDEAKWPHGEAKLFADLALRCCEMAHDRRPSLEEDVMKVLESMSSRMF